MQKGQATWVSVALYTALGIVAIAIVLTAGMPIIEKLKDKNTVTQTKEMMYELDSVVRETFEGPGSQREFFIEVKKGDFFIDKDKDEFLWSMKTKAKLIEPGATVSLGNLEMIGEKTNVEGEFLISLKLSYSGIADIDSGLTKLSGRYNLLIRNEGIDGIRKISINEV